MAWSYHELTIPPDLEPESNIRTYLDRVGCTCRPMRWSVFCNLDAATQSWEYECLSCHARVVILSHSPCEPSFNLKERS